MPAPSANDSKRPSASAALDPTQYKDQEIARDAETPVKAFYQVVEDMCWSESNPVRLELEM